MMLHYTHIHKLTVWYDKYYCTVGIEMTSRTYVCGIGKLTVHQPVVGDTNRFGGIGDVGDLEACSPADCIVTLHFLLLRKACNSLTLLRHSSSLLYKVLKVPYKHTTLAVATEGLAVHVQCTHLHCGCPCIQRLSEVGQLSLCKVQ